MKEESPFTIKWYDKPKSGHAGHEAHVYYKGGFLCSLISWGFDSCAVCHLQQMSAFNLSEEELELFWSWLFTTVDDYEDWNPLEAYFLLSDWQLDSANKTALVTHSNVKKIDRFLNKAHGPNYVNLFRYSEKNDFKGV